MSAAQSKILEQLQRLKGSVESALSIVETIDFIEDDDCEIFLPPEHRGRNAMQLGDFIIYDTRQNER